MKSPHACETHRTQLNMIIMINADTGEPETGSTGRMVRRSDVSPGDTRPARHQGVHPAGRSSSGLSRRTAITDDIRKLVRENKAAIIQELLAAHAQTPATQPEPVSICFRGGRLAVHRAGHARGGSQGRRRSGTRRWNSDGPKRVSTRIAGGIRFPMGRTMGWCASSRAIARWERSPGSTSRSCARTCRASLTGSTTPTCLSRGVRNDFEKPIRESTTLSEKRR